MALTLAEQEEPLVVGTLAPHIATIAQERLVAAPQVGGGAPSTLGVFKPLDLMT